MTLDAQSAAIVAAIDQRFPRLGTEVLDAAQARAILAAKPAPPIPGPAIHEVTEQTVPGAEGAPPVRVRIYRPRPTAAGELLPAVVYFHGGGFVLCSLDSHDAICRQLALEVDTVVISVDYRLAPEHPYPAALDDSWSAVRWTVDQALDLGVDHHRIAVAGDSAGGNLAAAVALRSGADSDLLLKFQLLVYPMVDLDFANESYRDNGHGYAVTVDHLRWYWQQYLGDLDAISDPLAVPAQAVDLSAMPPALVVAAQHCPLRTENQVFAGRLAAAGVDTELVEYPGVAHGFFTLGHALDTGKLATTETFAKMRGVLHG